MSSAIDPPIGTSFEAVLWDYGGVFTASPFGAVDRLANEMGVSAQVLLGAIFGPYDRDTDHPWHGGGDTGWTGIVTLTHPIT